ncbi:hypothetical protein ABIC33_001726 [Variovorax sp. 1140]|uniref:hypothetical protein n=1 Tax=Variovorax atrisoli TaxID=3394203 RepID=UPI0033926AE0
MNGLVSKVIGLWQGADGQLAEVVYEGDDSQGGIERWRAVDSLKAPCIRLRTRIELNDGRRVTLAIDEIAHILPDRTGVLVLFSNRRRPLDASDDLVHFALPDNAAVFNADGSLRFRLKNPAGKDGDFRAVVSLSLADGTRGVGVRACPKDWPSCEDVYVVDGSTDDLSRQIPRWVRD